MIFDGLRQGGFGTGCVPKVPDGGGNQMRFHTVVIRMWFQILIGSLLTNV